jgi:hypothetical protein
MRPPRRGGRRPAWTARALAVSTVLAARGALAQPATPPAPLDPDPPPAVYDVSPEGRRFRVGFDPGSRVWLGAAGTVARGVTTTVTGGLEVSAGVGIRNRSFTGEGKDRVSWENDHRILPGWVRPVPGPTGLPAWDAALYSVTMLRHDASPSIVVPTSPPVGIPFPFDVGLDADVGRVTSLVYPGLHEVRFGVVRGAFLLDPWRSGLPGHSLSFGLGARYDIETGIAGTHGPVVHRVAPMTAGSVRFRYQTRDGITVVDFRGDAVPHFTSEGVWRFLAQGSLHVERALVALGDQPIAAFLDGGYRYDPQRSDAPAVSDFRASLGLSVNLMLR